MCNRGTVIGVAILALALAAGAAGTAPYFKGEFIYQNDPGRPQCHCASIIQLKNGDMLCAWYSGTEEGAPDVAVRYSRKPRGASSWAAPATLADTPNRPEGNPVLWQDPTGKVWCFYCTQMGDGWRSSQLRCIASTDNGRTWSKPVNMARDLGYLVRCHALVASNGNWILPAYDERDWTGLMFISTNRGKTWAMSQRISDGGGFEAGVIQPSVIERRDHALRALLRKGPKPALICESYSRDFGRTWTRPQPTRLPNPNASVDQVKLRNGHVALIFNNSGTERTPLTAALSTDEGATWKVMRNLETADGEYSYPSVMQSSDGLIHVVYTHRRTQIRHVVFNEEWLRAGAR